MTDPVVVVVKPEAPATSPTGVAILPQVFLKIGTAIVGVATLFLSILPSLPDAPWIKPAQAIATAVVGLGVILGISSQGIRRVGTVDQALEVINKP